MNAVWLIESMNKLTGFCMHFSHGSVVIGILPKNVANVGEAPFRDVQPTCKLYIIGICILKADQTSLGIESFCG